MAILFDLDGTLLDTAPDFAHALNILRATSNLPPLSTSDIRPAVSEGITTLIQVGFGLPEEDPQNTQLAADFLSLYQKNICLHTQFFPGIQSLLTALEAAKIPWGIVTNKKGYLTERIVKIFSLKERASCIISGDTTPYFKPHPAPLFRACEILQVSPEQCIYIGDAERDIQAGKAAGMTTIGALFGYITNIESALQWQADHYVHHADELLPWIKKWQVR
jgi:2-phosphoglycolate phosphatase